MKKEKDFELESFLFYDTLDKDLWIGDKKYLTSGRHIAITRSNSSSSIKKFNKFIDLINKAKFNSLRTIQQAWCYFSEDPKIEIGLLHHLIQPDWWVEKKSGSRTTKYCIMNSTHYYTNLSTEEELSAQMFFHILEKGWVDTESFIRAYSEFMLLTGKSSLSAKLTLFDRNNKTGKKKNFSLRFDSEKSIKEAIDMIKDGYYYEGWGRERDYAELK